MLRHRIHTGAGRLLFAGAILASVGCSDSDSPPPILPDDGPLNVRVVNHPLQYFAERIGGEAVNVAFPAPPDVDPAFWRPDAAAIQLYQSADVILLNGAGYALWVQQATLAPSKLVDTSGAFDDRFIIMDDAITHTHGPGGNHAHGGTAFTTWLDLSLAVEQARAVTDALSARRPAHSPDFERSFDELEADLLRLDRRIRDLVASSPPQPLIVSHPVYQYWSRAYGLSVQAVHWEPDEAPTAAMWADLRDLLVDHPADWMIWEDEPVAETVQRLEEMGVGSIVFNPCGNARAGGDFLTVMQRNIDALSTALTSADGESPGAHRGKGE